MPNLTRWFCTLQWPVAKPVSSLSWFLLRLVKTLPLFGMMSLSKSLGWRIPGEACYRPFRLHTCSFGSTSLKISMLIPLNGSGPINFEEDPCLARSSAVVFRFHQNDPGSRPVTLGCVHLAHWDLHIILDYMTRELCALIAACLSLYQRFRFNWAHILIAWTSARNFERNFPSGSLNRSSGRQFCASQFPFPFWTRLPSDDVLFKIIHGGIQW